MKFLILTVFMLLCLGNAIAEKTSPKEELYEHFALLKSLKDRVNPENYFEVRSWDSKVPFLIGPTWREDLLPELYPWNLSKRTEWYVKMLYKIEYNVPILDLLAKEHIARDETFSDELARKISQQCKANYPNDYWQQIRCVVDYSGSREPYKRGHRACQGHAYSITKLVGALNIPGVAVTYHIEVGKYADDLTSHIVNLLILTTKDNVPVSYILDANHYENSLFPFSVSAQRWHEINGNGLPGIQRK